MYRLVFVLIAVVSAVFAQDDNQTIKQPFAVSVVQAPDRLFKNQVFSVKLQANTASALTYTIGDGQQPLNLDAKWKKDGDSQLLTLYFKAAMPQTVFPELNVTDANNQSIVIESQTLPTEVLPTSPYSCGVLSSKLKVNSARIDQYDSAHNIVLLDIVAENANLTDFRVPIGGQQGVTQIKNSYPDSQLFYFVTVANTQNVLEFQYFNTEKAGFETVSVPLDLQKVKELVSTQSDLQPKTKDKATYIFIVVSLLGAVLYAIYYFKREKIFLILIVVTLIVGAGFLFIPNKIVVVKKDCVVYLLPTESSTPFYKTSADIEVELLKQTDGFTKIKLENSRIGWVKDECVQIKP